MRKFINSHFYTNGANIKFTDNKIFTADPCKGTYIELLSQQPPNNDTFVKAGLKYIQAKYIIMYTNTLYCIICLFRKHSPNKSLQNIDII